MFLASRSPHLLALVVSFMLCFFAPFLVHICMYYRHSPEFSMFGRTFAPQLSRLHSSQERVLLAQRMLLVKLLFIHSSYTAACSTSGETNNIETIQHWMQRDMMVMTLGKGKGRGGGEGRGEGRMLGLSGVATESRLRMLIFSL